MPNNYYAKRGPKANIGSVTAKPGELFVVKDTQELYFGVANEGQTGPAVPLKLYTANIIDKGLANGVAVLDANQKIPLANMPTAALGVVQYIGTWDAAANSPAIPVASEANKGYYYVVSTPGTTAIDGISDWEATDWIVSNGSTWQKVDNTDKVNSVNGKTGTVVLTTSDIAEGTNLYYTDTRVNAVIDSRRGVANGIASLDANSLIPTSQIPDIDAGTF